MLSWVSILRLGLAQMSLGAIIVLMTSTLNRIMVVELALPALVPGLLVGLHYAMQLSRPGWGHWSDLSRRRTPWIVGGMAVLALGGFLAALAVAIWAAMPVPGLVLSMLAYALIGAGAGASGTSVLAFLAAATAPRRRAAAATIIWLMMIFGIAATAGIVGALLDPYSPGRLLGIVACVSAGAVVLTTLALLGLEKGGSAPVVEARQPLRKGIMEIWAEPQARRFTQFVFLSMTAYFMQELILEPYAGLVFGLTPGQSTSLSGAQNGGVFVGMLAVGIAATGLGIGSLRAWVVGGCTGSAATLLGIALIGPLQVNLILPLTILLGFCNGVFAVAAIGAMMALAGQGRSDREGTRMGLWGAAQAIAAGVGGLTGAVAVDALRLLLAPDLAFAAVFAAEAVLFLVAAGLALRVIDPGRERHLSATLVPGE
ncbi:MAG: BCD family MFS transporter [Rhodobacter sp.]|nr:BCD family MFS transporter [Rhodobacter sp.]MCA3455682.1 BCD family MFS transporter [Rhodobacter sp.]MCA3461602.1 BCD family MFS transporter [Rhodobacter sp.]MCA3464077.1 BCD family MFS transporter [Rhodobacter sp.]MCA3466176.1 BCD family MFS transporter [Rhodobacter sp.]